MQEYWVGSCPYKLKNFIGMKNILNKNRRIVTYKNVESDRQSL